MSHAHDYEPMRALSLRSGPPVDYRLLSRYVGAVYDRCETCRRRTLDVISEDPVTAAGFVAMVAAGAREEAGPRALETLRRGQDGDAGADAVALMLVDNAAVQYEPVFVASRAMSVPQRRAAVDFATGLFVALLSASIRRQDAG